MSEYADIIHKNRPKSAKHRPMPVAERAKQFMPYATLRGFGLELADREILSDEPAAEDEDSRMTRDALLRELMELLSDRKRPRVSFTRRVTDHRGRLVSTRGEGIAEHISPEERTVRIGGVTYPLDEIELTAVSDDAMP